MALKLQCRSCTTGWRKAAQPAPFVPAVRVNHKLSQRQQSPWLCRSADPNTEPEAKGDELENPDSEAARKKAEADRLRAAEKFMVIGAGEASCKGCGYEYRPDRGDPEFPVPKGVKFQDLPQDYSCPICGAPKEKFESRVKVVAGFAENQKYGLGSNSMTEDQKSLLIYGSLAVAVILFLSGYALN